MSYLADARCPEIEKLPTALRARQRRRIATMRGRQIARRVVAQRLQLHREHEAQLGRLMLPSFKRFKKALRRARGGLLLMGGALLAPAVLPALSRFAAARVPSLTRLAVKKLRQAPGLLAREAVQRRMQSAGPEASPIGPATQASSPVAMAEEDMAFMEASRGYPDTEMTEVAEEPIEVKSEPAPANGDYESLGVTPSDVSEFGPLVLVGIGALVLWSLAKWVKNTGRR